MAGIHHFGNAVIIDYGQQFTLSNEDVRDILNRSEVGKVITNGAQVSAGILINGMFARHAEIVANEHSEAADMLREAAQKH